MDLWTPNNCLTFNLQKASRRLARRMDAVLVPLELTGQQFSVMAVLAQAPSLPVTKIAEITGAERTTVTRNMDRLKARGLVAVDPGNADGRVSALGLTEMGRALFDQALPLWRDIQKKALDDLDGIAPEPFLASLKGF